MDETILVTGGAGFIGSHVCERLLKDGHKVINLDNFNDYYNPKVKEENIKLCIENPNYELYRGDIRDKDLVESIFKNHKVSKVIHLAAMAGVRNSLEDPLEYIDVDIKGTVNLLGISRKYEISRFLFASSSSVYGINSKTPFSEEDTVELQISPYATAKRAGELYCSTYHHLYQLSIGCLRFFTVYGPRQRPEMAIHNFVRRIDNGEEIQFFGSGESLRDYTYIDDIVDGIIQALIVGYDFEVFNLGNSDTISLSELVKEIESSLGKKAKLKKLPNQKGDVPLTYADISYSQRILNYNPRTNIKEGIRKFVDWYYENKK